MKTGIVQRVLAFPFSGRQSALAKSRPALSHSDFVDSVTRSGGDPKAAELVHLKLQDWIYHENFTPYPEDSLGSVFGIAEEELDEDLILDILVKLDLPSPSHEEVAAFGPIDTAIDVARFITSVRQVSRL